MTDDIDQILISALMEDSRRSLKALAQISGLSSPSVAERLRRLEERGVLKGYTVEIDPKQTHLTISGIDRQKVGQVAADMRSLRKPDPYKNKGVRYSNEKLKKKAGKTGAK